jgi:DNA-binding HxlR family transcriptional regulator
MTSEPPCGVHKAVDLIGSKWTLLILHRLCSKAQGFNALLHGIDGINPRALSTRLKEMAEHGLVTKKVHPTSPPQVEYALTPQGAALKSIIEQLGEWAVSLPSR